MCRSHQNDQRNREAHYIQERTVMSLAGSRRVVTLIASFCIFAHVEAVEPLGDVSWI